MKKSFCLLLILCFVFFSGTLRAQSWNWAVGSNGYNYDNVQAMCVDNNGNTYIAGQFYYTVTFPAVSGSITLTSPDSDLYVACFNAAGQCLWAKPIVLSIMGQEIRDMAINNATGECFVTGWFFGTATIGTLPVLTSAGGSDILVAKFNMANGNPIWAKRIGNATDNLGSKIGIDPSGNSYIMGDISSPTSGSITIAPLAAVTGNIFAVKLNAAGTAQWARGITGSAAYADVRADATGSYLFGSFYTTLTTGALTLTPASGSSAYLIKLNNSDGTVAWGRSTTGAAASGTAMDINSSGNIIIGGTCGTTTQFSGSGVSSGTGLGPAYLTQYNTSGSVIRADQIAATEIADLDTDCANNAYICSGGVTVKKFVNPSFGFGQAWSLSGTTTYVAASDGGGVGVDQAGNVYVAGSFESTATFGAITLTSTGAGDAREAYIAKIVSYVTPIINPVLICTNSGSTTLTVTNPQPGLSYWWYTTATGGTALNTGTSYFTGTLTTTTTFYVAAYTASDCQTVTRVPVTVTVNNSCCPTFVAPIVNNVLICTNSGKATLTVTNPQAGYTYAWYSLPSGGSALNTGTSYQTVTLTATTTYYVTGAGSPASCPSTSRVPVTVTVNNSCCPTFILPTVNNVHICNSGSAVFNVTNPQTGYIYKWYTASTGGTAIATGTSYVTGTLTATTTYYVEAGNSTTCPVSSRVAATATVDNSCCSTANVSISSSQMDAIMGDDVTYQISITNPGTSSITVNSVTSIAFTPAFNVTTINGNSPFVPFVVAPSQTITVSVLGTYAGFTTSSPPVASPKCFSLTINGCSFQVCQPTIVWDPLGVDDASFSINSNNVPVRTSQAVSITGNNSSGTNYWYVKPFGGSYAAIPGNGNTVTYAFPDLGNYSIQHMYGSHTLTKTVTVTGENRALAFSTAEVNAGTNSNYGIGNYTLEAYIKPTSLPTAANSKACILSNVVSNYGFELGINNSGKLYFYIDGTTYVNSTGTTFSNGTCYHIAITLSGTTYTFYVNGIAEGTFTAGNPSYNEATLFLGRSSFYDGYSYGQYVGLMEDVRIWSVARTQSQLSSNIYMTLIGTETGLLSYWPINEGSGTTIYDLKSTNNGTLSGQTWTTMSCGGMRESDQSSNTNYQQTSDNVSVYPVPFTNETNIIVHSANNESVSIVITDLLGSEVYKAHALNSNTSYTIGKDFTSGIYTVAIRCGEQVEYRKIVKQ